ncbi:hypothetical protein AgCh_029211 [Apium graveolens]
MKLKVEIGALWNFFNQEDFLPISEEISEDDYNDQQAEFVVKVPVDTLGELRIYFKYDSLNLLNKEVIENYSTMEFERVISLMTENDAFTKLSEEVSTDIEDLQRRRNKASTDVSNASTDNIHQRMSASTDKDFN